MIAAYSGNVECVRMLLAAGADVNAAYDGWTALMSAASKGKIECVKLLIDAGADLNHKDRHNYSALYYAAYHGHFRCVSLLRSAGAEGRYQADLITPRKF